MGEKLSLKSDKLQRGNNVLSGYLKILRTFAYHKGKESGLRVEEVYENKKDTRFKIEVICFIVVYNSKF